MSEQDFEFTATSIPPDATPPSRYAISRRVADNFVRNPHAFEFFQAVRLLRRMQRIAHRRAAKDASSQDAGYPTALPDAVRFRAWPSLIFPTSEIAGAEQLKIDALTGDEPFETVSLTVAFMGLFGPSGALPRHYTQLLLDRIRLKDHSLRDFLDLFNHRLIAMFYDAWAKYRLPIVFEQHALAPRRTQDDPVTQSLFSMVGMATPGLRDRLPFSDHVLLYYAGAFSHSPRNGIGLERIVADFYQLPTRLIQLHGQWLYLKERDQSRLGGTKRRPSNNQLGTDVVVGRRVWGVENSFRLRLGPLTYAQFREFTPEGTKLASLDQFVTTYVGPSFDFDVQLVLRHDEIPRSQLAGGIRAPISRLGWNTWLYNRPLNADRDDAVFAPS